MNALTGALDIMTKAVERTAQKKKPFAITVNHKDAEIKTMIMRFLENYNVNGNEPEMLNEPLYNLLPGGEWIKLEIYLSDYFDSDITLPKDLKFIEEI